MELNWVDERAVPPAGRIGETEDLIGSVFVQDGKVSISDLSFLASVLADSKLTADSQVVVDTYDPTPSYRLVTSNGPLLLPRGLDKYLLEVLEKIDKEEKTGTRS